MSTAMPTSIPINRALFALSVTFAFTHPSSPSIRSAPARCDLLFPERTSDARYLLRRFAISPGYALPRGRWVKIDQEVILNEPDREDGVLRVWLDGALAIDKGNIAYRVKPDVTLTGVAADIFYNGEDIKGRAPADAKVLVSPFEIRWP